MQDEQRKEQMQRLGIKATPEEDHGDGKAVEE